MSVLVKSHPSLALVKYWGKQSVEENTPATSSLAINLEALVTESKISVAKDDQVLINGEMAPIERYLPFFTHLRKRLSFEEKFSVESKSNFPVAAGLASSSSGFAALALGCAHLAQPTLSLDAVSSFARLGSASAARSVFSGFTILEKGEKSAKPLFPSTHWEELRVIIAIVQPGQKKISSRDAMQHCKDTSPFYSTWVEHSETLYTQGLKACQQKDLSVLGPIIRKSYLEMFATLFSSSPPILYWEPESLSLIKKCEELRNQGLEVFETMDAGPQVKMLCQESQLEEIVAKLDLKVPYLVSKVGGGAKILS